MFKPTHLKSFSDTFARKYKILKTFLKGNSRPIRQIKAKEKSSQLLNIIYH